MASKSVLTLEIKSRLKAAVAEIKGVQDAILGLDDSAKDAGNSIDGLSKDFEELGGTAKKTMGVVAGAITGATVAYGSFEKQTVNVQNITEATDASMAQLAASIMQLPPTLGEADDIMAGLYQTISAGVTGTEDAFGVIVASAKAAKGNLSDMTQTVDAGTSILNAYGLEASEITEVLDAMTKTVDLGKLTFAELADNIGKGVSITSAADVSYQELMATLATLTLNGLSVEESMTAVRNILRVALKPTKEESEAMAELGVDLSLTALQAQGFGKWMGEAAKATEGNAAATAALFPNMRAMNGAMKLASEEGGAKYLETLNEIENSAGKVERNFERMSATVTGQTEALTAEFKKLGIEFGELTSDEVQGLIGGMTDIISVIRNLDPEAKDLIITAGEWAAIWGALVLAAPKVLAAYKAISTAITATGTSAATAMSGVAKFNLAIGAGTALGLAFAEMLDNVNQEFLRAGAEGSGQAFNEQAESISAMQAALKELYGSVDAASEHFGESATALSQNADAYLENLRAAEDLTETEFGLGTAMREARLEQEKNKELAEDFEKVMKKAAEIEKKRREEAEKLAKAKKKEADASKDAKEAAEKETKARKEANDELMREVTALKKSADAREEAKTKADRLADAERELLKVEKNMADYLAIVANELGLVGVELDDTTIYMRSLNDQLDDLDKMNVDAVTGAVIDMTDAMGLSEEAAEDLFLAIAQEIEPPSFAGWRKQVNEISDYFKESLGFAIMDGLSEFDNFGDYLEGLMDDWGAMITDVIGGALGEAFKTGDFGALGGNLIAGMQDLGLAGVVGGLSMVYQATQMMDQTTATIQGIIGGAQVGGQAGGWIGAIIGGVLGGAAGYFGSGDEEIPTTTVSRIGAVTSVRPRHQGDVAELELERIERQLKQAFDDIKVGYLDLLRVFEDPALFDFVEKIEMMFPGGEEFEGTIDEVIQWLVGGLIPEHMEATFKEALSAGFADLNVQQEVIDALFGELSRMTGDDRFTALETYIRAIVNNAKLLEGLDWNEMIRVASADPREAFGEAIRTILDQAELQFAGFEHLSLTEQADQALVIQELIDQARQAELQYLTQILQLSEDIARSIGQQIEALELGGMNLAEQTRAIFGNIGDIFDDLLVGGLDPNTIAQLTGDAQNYISMLQTLFGEDIDLTLGEILGGIEEADLSGFEDYVAAFEANANALAGLDWEAMIQEATIDPRTAFVNSVTGMLDEASLLLTDFDDPTDALAIMGLVDQARQAEIQYLGEILRLSDDISRSIQDQIDRLRMGGMTEQEQGEFVADRLENIFDQLGMGGLDAATIAQLTGDAQGFIAMLEDLFGENIDLDLVENMPDVAAILGELFGGGEFADLGLDLEGTGREFLISLLEALDVEAQGALDDNITQIQDLNEQQIGILERLNDALAAFADSLVTYAFGGSGAILQEQGVETGAGDDIFGLLTGLGFDLDDTGRALLIALLDTLNTNAQAAIQDQVDEIAALNEEQIDILQRLNLALTGFNDQVERIQNLLGAQGQGGETDTGFGDAGDIGDITDYDEFNIPGKEPPPPTSQGSGAEGVINWLERWDDLLTEPDAWQVESDRGAGDTGDFDPGGEDPDAPGPSGMPPPKVDELIDSNDRIVDAIEELVKAIANMKPPKVEINQSPDLAALTRTVKTVVAQQFSYRGQTS